MDDHVIYQKLDKTHVIFWPSNKGHTSYFHVMVSGGIFSKTPELGNLICNWCVYESYISNQGFIKFWEALMLTSAIFVNSSPPVLHGASWAGRRGRRCDLKTRHFCIWECDLQSLAQHQEEVLAHSRGNKYILWGKRVSDAAQCTNLCRETDGG